MKTPHSDFYWTDFVCGAKPPKGQELDDHYFGAIKPTVAAFMEDLNEESGSGAYWQRRNTMKLFGTAWIGTYLYNN